MTIVIEKANGYKLLAPKFSTVKKITLITSFAIIPLCVLGFYGIEDNTAWFFGHDYINDYRYRIDGVVHNIGIMVGHFALIVTLSVVGLLIAWIVYEILKESNIIHFAKVTENGKF